MDQQHGYGSPLSPVIEDFMMDVFKKVALNQETHKLPYFFYYVNGA
jgi:hypothetical protein